MCSDLLFPGEYFSRLQKRSKINVFLSANFWERQIDEYDNLPPFAIKNKWKLPSPNEINHMILQENRVIG